MLPRIVLALVAAACFFLPTATRAFDSQLLPPTGDVPQLIRRFVMYVGIALGLVWLTELVFATVATAISRRLEQWSVTAAAHPWITVTVTALVATLIHWIAAGSDPGTSFGPTLVAHRFIWSWGVGAAALMAVGTTAPASIAAASSAFLGFSAFSFNHPAMLVLTYAPWVLAAWFLLARASDRRAYAVSALLLAVASALVLFVSPPHDAVAMLVVLWSIGLLAILFGEGPRGVKAYRFVAAVVVALTMLLLTAARGWLALNSVDMSAVYADAAHVRFAARAQTLSMILGSLAPVPMSPGLQTLTAAFVMAAVLSPRRLLAHPSSLACVLGAAMAIVMAHGVLIPELLVRAAAVPSVLTVALSLLTASIVPILIVSALGVRAVLEASRAPLAIMTVAIAVGAGWVFTQVAAWSGTGRINGWLTLFALAGAVAVPASFRAAARSFPRVLPIVSAAALAGLLLSLGLFA